MSTTTRKKRVIKPKVAAKTLIEKELAILEAEMPDLMVPEPIQGSPFLRKGFVECISNKDMEEMLVIGKTYQVNELHMDGVKLEITCEDGDHHWVHGKYFKAIDYGPFKQGDTVLCHGFDGATPIKGEIELGLLGNNATVKDGDETHATVSWGASFKFKIPNENLRLRQRRTQLKTKNPFGENDVIRCIKAGRGGLCVGWIYHVKFVEGDFVFLKEDHDGDRYYHTMFVKYDKLKKKKEVIKLLTLDDYVRKFYNKFSYEKLTPAKLIKHMKEEKVPKEYLDEAEIIKALKKVQNEMFHW